MLAGVSNCRAGMTREACGAREGAAGNEAYRARAEALLRRL